MFTIYTTCRPFDIFNFGLIQSNALTSWSFINPKPQVLVLGNEYGTSEICERLGYTHVPDIVYSKYGTPRLDILIKIAEAHALHDHLLHLSSDVFIFQDTVNAYQALTKRFKEFCGVCIKNRQPVVKEIDFSNILWERDIKDNTRLVGANCGDFFLFNKGYWEDMPPFLIGRCACDSWMFWRGGQKGNMVDLSDAITIVDYPNRHPEKHFREEVDYNHDICTRYPVKLFERDTVHDSSWKMNSSFELYTKSILL